MYGCVPDWLMDEIYGLPPDLQFGAYQAIEYRSRMNANVFAQEITQLQYDLAEYQQAHMRVAATAQWIGALFPHLQGDVFRIIDGGDRARGQAFRDAAKGGVDLTRFF